MLHSAINLHHMTVLHCVALCYTVLTVLHSAINAMQHMTFSISELLPTGVVEDKSTRLANEEGELDEQERQELSSSSSFWMVLP